jgi:threonine dehydratase
MSGTDLRFTAAELEDAADRIYQYIAPTQLRRAERLSKLLNANVYVKHEYQQPGGSFKVRGALNALLGAKEKPAHVVTSSGGNHGLGVAYASQRIGVPCTCVLPERTPEHRSRAIQEMGAATISKGMSWDESHSEALELAKKPGHIYVHPFANRDVIMGQGTIALEILRQMKEPIDFVVGSIGGGGLLGGIALALEAMGSPAKVVGVETEGANCMNESLKKGEVVDIGRISSIATTLGARKTTPELLEVFQRLCTQTFVVSDRDAVLGMRNLINLEKILVEPACACCLAALTNHAPLFKGKTVVLVACGANVYIEEFNAWCQDMAVV